MTSLAESLPQQREQNLHIHHLPIPKCDAVAEIVQGLQRPQKQLSPKFFYDAQGWLNDDLGAIFSQGGHKCMFPLTLC